MVEKSATRPAYLEARAKLESGTNLSTSPRDFCPSIVKTIGVLEHPRGTSGFFTSWETIPSPVAANSLGIQKFRHRHLGQPRFHRRGNHSPFEFARRSCWIDAPGGLCCNPRRESEGLPRVEIRVREPHGGEPRLHSGRPDPWNWAVRGALPARAVEEPQPGLGTPSRVNCI